MNRRVPVRKAVLPMAGWGTRFRPVTHVVPKEFLPILNRPVLHYIFDELAAAGCTDIVCVLMPGRDLVTPYLEKAGVDLRCTIVWQTEAKGLGHAVGCAERAVGDEPFFVVLPDVVIDAATPVCAQLAQTHAAHGTAGVIALRPEPREKLSQYGVAAFDRRDGNILHLTGLVEKPAPAHAPSDLTIVGRYLLPPSTFRHLRETPPGAKGEIQLTDALQRIAQSEGLLGLVQEDTALFDAGQVPGWLAANVYFGKKAGFL